MPNIRSSNDLRNGYNEISAFFTINEKEKVVDVERILYSRRDWAILI